MSMSIDWLNFDESSSDELPWLREFVEAGGDYDTPIDVECCVIGLKGILVMTNSYKAFVFKGSKLANHLTEALPIYVKTKTGNQVLVACGNKDGKLQLGLDQLRLEAIWKNDKFAYFQHVKQSGDLQTERLQSTNPLIPTPSPRVTGATSNNTKNSPKNSASPA